MKIIDNNNILTNKNGVFKMERYYWVRVTCNSRRRDLPSVGRLRRRIVTETLHSTTATVMVAIPTLVEDMGLFAGAMSIIFTTESTTTTSVATIITMVGTHSLQEGRNLLIYRNKPSSPQHTRFMKQII